MNLRVSALFLMLSVVIGLAPFPARGQGADTCRKITDPSGEPIMQADSGQCDTVRVGCPLEYSGAELADLIGDSIAIPVYVWNDQELSGFSMGFSYNSNTVEITSIDKTGTVVPGVWSFSATFDSVDNQVLVGALDLCIGSCVPLPPTPGETGLLFFKLNMRILPGAAAQHITLDSIFVDPGGTFTLAPTSGKEIPPGYAHCDSHDIMLPVAEIDRPFLPDEYSLSQNVPNPFNPTTFIEFSLPHSGDVKVEIFNVMGQKVKTLVNEYLRAGDKRATWDGTDDRSNHVSSGVYFYRIKAGEFSETRKMLLLR